MYLHAMPVVSLDYYLPQLMMGVNDVSFLHVVQYRSDFVGFASISAT